jgi:hypothetical protein
MAVSKFTCYYVFLNGVRALSLIGLLLVFASSIFVFVNDVRAVNFFDDHKGAADSDSLTNCDYIENSTVPHQAGGAVWAYANHTLIIVETFILIVTEMWHHKTYKNSVSGFFDKWFPILGPNFGLGALGIFQCLISASILSHHVDDFSLVSAFFLFSVGCINMLLGLFFRERVKNYRSYFWWKKQGEPIIPQHVGSFAKPLTLNTNVPSVASYQHSRSGSSAGSYYSEKTGYGYGADKKSQYEQDYDNIAAARAGSPQDNRAGFGFGTAGQKQAAMRGFILKAPGESVPRYAPGPAAASRSGSVAGSSRASSTTRAESEGRGRSYSPRQNRRELPTTRERSPSPETSYTASRESSPERHERHERPIPTYISSPTAL